jgi:hypothetical protein
MSWYALAVLIPVGGHLTYSVISTGYYIYRFFKPPEVPKTELELLVQLTKENEKIKQRLKDLEKGKNDTVFLIGDYTHGGEDPIESHHSFGN